MKKYAITLVLLLSTHLYANSFKTEKWLTENGTKVVFYQAMEVPILSINIAFAAGSAYDSTHFGLAALTGRMLAQGSANLDANQIAEQLADTGAQYSNETSRDMAAFSLNTLNNEAALNQAIATFTLMLTKPAFHIDSFNHEKNQQLIALSQSLESPDDVANKAFFNLLYKTHPYGHPINGNNESVKSLSLLQVRDFYKRYYVASNGVLVIVGAINSEKAHALATQITKDLPMGKPADPIEKATPLSNPETANIPFTSSQTVIRLGQIGVSHANPDYMALNVGNYILGGGALVSRLSDEVREKRGLTYDVNSQFIPMPGEGPFIISLSTKTTQAQEALKVTQDTLNAYLSTGPTLEELNGAKQYLTGSFALSLASNSNIANTLLRLTFYNLPDDYLDTYKARVEAISIDDVKQAFDRLIHPDKMVLIQVGKM